MKILILTTNHQATYKTMIIRILDAVEARQHLRPRIANFQPASGQWIVFQQMIMPAGCQWIGFEPFDSPALTTIVGATVVRIAAVRT